MKVEADLRIAIRSAEKAQPYNDNWEAKRARRKAAIEELLNKKPSHRRAVATAKQIKAKANRLGERADKIFDKLGIRPSLEDIQDEDAFKKAGGTVPAPVNGRWKADSVISELLSADPKQRTAILKKYNIRWE